MSYSVPEMAARWFQSIWYGTLDHGGYDSPSDCAMACLAFARSALSS